MSATYVRPAVAETDPIASAAVTVEATARAAADLLKQDASTAATDAELAAEVAADRARLDAVESSGGPVKKQGQNSLANPATGAVISFAPDNAAAKTYSGPERVIEFMGGTFVGAGSPRNLASYMTKHGQFYTGTEIVMSNKRANTDDPTIQGLRALSGVPEPLMLSISPDVNGPSLGIEAWGSLPGGAGPTGHNNNLALATYDMEAVHSGVTPQSGGYGTKRFGFTSTGKMFWAPDLGMDPAAAVSRMTLERATGLNGLRVSGSTTDANLIVSAPTAQLAAFKTEINGVTAINLACSSTTAAHMQLGGQTVMRMYNSAGGRMSIGGADDAAGTLTITGNNTAIPTLRIKGVVSQTADQVQILSSATAIQSRFGPSGRFMTRVATAPVLADMVDGELAISLDAGGNLIVTSRVAGALKTATVAVA